MTKIEIYFNCKLIAYPGCKSGITEYSVMYNKETTYIANGDTYINTVSTPSYGTLNYEMYVNAVFFK